MKLYLRVLESMLQAEVYRSVAPIHGTVLCSGQHDTTLTQPASSQALLSSVLTHQPHVQGMKLYLRVLEIMLQAEVYHSMNPTLAELTPWPSPYLLPDTRPQQRADKLAPCAGHEAVPARAGKHAAGGGVPQRGPHLRGPAAQQPLPRLPDGLRL